MSHIEGSRTKIEGPELNLGLNDSVRAEGLVLSVQYLILGAQNRISKHSASYRGPNALK